MSVVLVAEAGDCTDGKTETLNGLARIPEVMDNDTGNNLDISLPIKVGAENSTCRTTDHYNNNIVINVL